MARVPFGSNAAATYTAQRHRMLFKSSHVTASSDRVHVLARVHKVKLPYPRTRVYTFGPRL